MDKIKQIGFKAGEKPRRPVIQADTSASKSYASIAYGISEGEIVGLIDGAKSVYLDGTPVMSTSGETNIPDVKIQERKGTNDQTHLEGFPAVVNEKQYNNIEMLQSSPFVHYINDTSLDAVGIRFTFGALQRTDPDNGDVSGITIEYAIDVQVDGQGYQELLKTSIVGKYAAGYQRYHRVELPPAEEGWEVRIRRLTPNTTSSYVADKMYLDAVAEILDVKMRYPNTALIGLKFDSERFSNIPKVDFRMRGKIIRVPANYDPVSRTYATSGEGTTNGIWNGQFKMAYTTNPAWIFYDLVLNKRYGLGNRIDASMLDKWSLYSIAQYCDAMVPDGEGGLEPRFTCNVYINNRFEAYDCLMQLAGVFRGIMYWSGTAIIAGCDRPQDPVFTYTRANIIGEFNYSGTRTKDRHSVVMVSFDDPRNNYKTEKEVVSDRKAISEIGIRTKDLAAFACTSRGQAQRAGKWALFKEQLETRIVTFALGMDGYIAPVGRIIEIADPLLAGRAIGGRIAAVSDDKTTITLDRDTEVKVGDRLVLNNEEGEQESRQVTGVSGRDVTVAVAFENPAVQHVWAIDSDDLQLMRFTVISVAENRSQDSITFTVTALQHEPELHEAADYSAYIERNNYTAIDITTQKAPTDVVISSVNRINQGIDITDLVISWKQAEKAVKYHVQWRRDDGNWIQMPLQYGNQVTIENIYHGVYEAQVVAINAAEVNSLPASSLPTPINSKFAEPAVPTSLTATGILFGVELKWKFPLYGAQNAAYVEIYWALNGNKSDEKLLGSYAYPTTETTINGLSPHQTLYFRARLVDRNGVASGYTPWVTATVVADPDKLLEVLNGHIGLEAIDAELSKAIEDNTTGVADAKALADQAKTAAANAQTTADDAGTAAANAATAAANAQTTATNAANAVAKEVTDRVAAVTAEANARAAAINKEVTDRTAAINKEATDRAAALAAQDTALKADSAAKVKALKDEVDPKITSLQNGITQVTTDYQAGDTAVVGQLNAYKTSNDSAVASVLQKAESAVATGSTNSSAITAINGQIATINNTKLDASVISGYYTKGQTDAKAAEIAAGKVEEFSASISNEHLQELLVDGDNTAYSDGSLYQVAGFTMKEPREVGATYTLRFKMSINRSGSDTTSYIRAYQGGNSALLRNYTEADDTIFEATFTAAASSPANEIRFYHFPNSPSAKAGTSVTIHWASLVKANDDAKAQTKAAIDANSTAIQNTNAEVTRVDGVATAANNATTALAGRVSTVEGAVATKAEAAALTALTTRVTEAEGVNTSQGSAITTLQNTVNHSTTGLATKASTSALTAVDNKVTAANGRIDTTNSNVTALEGRVDTVEGAVSTKAEAAALTALTTRVGNTESTNTSQGTAITTLQNTVNHSTTGLATKASTAALTATNSEVTRIDGVVSGHTNQLTQLTSDITAINGTLATKANASALNDIYTKTQTDDKATEIAVGEISKYDASLVIGGVNQLLDSEGERSSTATTRREYLLYEKSAHLKEFYEENLNKDVTISFDLKVAVAGSMTVYSSNGSFHSFSTGVNVTADNVDKWVRYSVTVKPTRHGSNTASNVSTLEFYGTYDTGRIPYVRKVQLEAGNKATDWSPSPRDTQAALDANATAIDNTNSEVSRVDGRVTTEANRITSLSGRVSTVEGQVSTKAEAAALSSLTTRVTEAEGVNTSQGSAITNLQNTVNHATTGLATKASSAALTAVDNRVTTVDGRVTTTNSNLTLLTGRVSTVEGALTTKADVSALNDIYTKSETDDKATELAAGEVSKFKASLDVINDSLRITGTTDTVENLKTASSTSLAALVTETTALTGQVLRIGDNAGNDQMSAALNSFILIDPTKMYRLKWRYRRVSGNGTVYIGIHCINADKTKQVTISNGYQAINVVGSNDHYAHSAGAPALGTWTEGSYYFKGKGVTNSTGSGTLTSPRTFARLAAYFSPMFIANYLSQAGVVEIDYIIVEDAEAISETISNASAIDTLNSEVARVDGRVTTESNRITTLTGRVSTVEGSKADVSALNALTTRVSDAEGGLATQVTATTNLTTSLATTDKIAKDALPQISSSSGYKVFRNVLNYLYSTAGSAFALVIQTPITFSAKMFKVTVAGYNYSQNRSNINLEVSAYAYNGTTFVNHGAINHGTFPVSVRLGVRDSKVVIILLRTVQNWAYPQFNVDAEIGYTTAPDTWKDGWSVTPMAEADFATNGITSIITPTTKDMPTEVAANASAISTLTSDVSDIEGTVTSQGQAITNLENSVNSPTTGLSTKASAQALTTLNNQVQHSTTGLSAVNTKVDNLKATVESPTTGLASKATAQALTTLNNQVQHSTTGLSAVNSKVDTLKATVESTSTGLPSKASSAALDTLSNKVNHSTTGLDAIANKTTVLEADVSKALDVITIKDTRSTNQPPSWYWSNYPRCTVNEFKTQSAIGVSGFFGGTYCNLETVVGWTGSSGGHLIQTATSSADPSLYVQRVSTSTSAWGAWAQPIKDLRDGLAGKAAASAVDSLTIRVTTAEGNISSEATKLSNLSTTVGGHTTSINTHTSSIDGIQAKHTVKINNNGFVTGYGLISTANNGAVVSAFKVDADAFAVGKSGSGILPFVVTTAGQTISGITYPAAGTWINSAYIANATIGTAHIKDLSVTTAKIGDGQITTAKIGDLQVDTLKIKDNAVTVPAAVVNQTAKVIVGNETVNNRPPQVYTGGNAGLLDTSAFFGDLVSITINRQGGKCRIEGQIVVQNFGGSLWTSPSKVDQNGASSIYIGAIILRNGVPIAYSRSSVDSVISYTVRHFTGSLTLPIFIDDAYTGTATYTLRVGVSTSKAGGVYIMLQGMAASVNEASIAILELKK